MIPYLNSSSFSTWTLQASLPGLFKLLYLGSSSFSTWALQASLPGLFMLLYLGSSSFSLSLSGLFKLLYMGSSVFKLLHLKISSALDNYLLSNCIKSFIRPNYLEPLVFYLASK